MHVHVFVCMSAGKGHYLDQKRLKQGLYRHPWDDISYLSPDVAMQ